MAVQCWCTSGIRLYSVGELVGMVMYSVGELAVLEEWCSVLVSK